MLLVLICQQNGFYSSTNINEINFFEGRFLYFNEEKVTVFIRNITQRKLFEEELSFYRNIVQIELNGLIHKTLNITLTLLQ